MSQRAVSASFIHYIDPSIEVFSYMKIFFLHLPNSFDNFSFEKVHRKVVDAWQTTGRYLVWKKKENSSGVPLCLLFTH
jgi:hypothetical protein